MIFHKIINFDATKIDYKMKSYITEVQLQYPWRDVLRHYIRPLTKALSIGAKYCGTSPLYVFSLDPGFYKTITLTETMTN